MYYKIKIVEVGGVGLNILISGNEKEKEILIQHMKSQSSMAFRLLDFSQTNNYDEFLELMQNESWDLIFVTMDNAAGMEGVIAVKNVHPQMPVIWFSNDRNFVAQSYRLGVNYFSVKPIEEKIVNLALERCQGREELA